MEDQTPNEPLEHAADPTPVEVAPAAPAAQKPPVKVDNRTRRSDEDALEGHLVDVIDGEHKGLYGTFVSVSEHAHDGYPARIVVQNRDHAGQFAHLVVVEYKDVRPSKRTGGR